MSKKWIAEVLYIIVAVLFLGICVMARSDVSVGQVDGLNTQKSIIGITEVPTPTIFSAKEDVIIPTEMIGQAITILPSSAEAPTLTESPTPAEALPLTEIPTPTEALPLIETPTPTEALPLIETPTPTENLIKEGKFLGTIEIKNENYEQYDNEMNAWWFIRKEDHSPSGSGEGFPIAPYAAYYRNTEVTDEDKVIYLTFDCGYENGFTPMILDTLAEKEVKAIFFVTKDFIAKNPDYVTRMKEEGHLVGNHTVRHLSSPSLTPEELEAELAEVVKTMFELTGYAMDPFFRPPMGEYSERTLKATQDMGYFSIFWSIAYYDYDVNDQPGKEYVVDHFSTYHHNGTVVLMHNTSQSNVEALGEVVDLLKAEGYRFGELTEITGK